MSFTVNLYYTGENGAAKAFVQKMLQTGVVAAIRSEPGNLKYDYFISFDDPETILLIDSWVSQSALDKHHSSNMMNQIAELREKYDLHMRVERYIDDTHPTDDNFIRQ